MSSELEAEHTPDAIRSRLARSLKPSYLRDWVYGGIDGAVTTFAVVAGVIGADLSTRVILILGIANLFADGFSMAAGNYSSTKTEIEDYRRLRAIERHHIDQVPDGEREEVRQILAKKGFSGDGLEEATNNVTASTDRWIDVMMQEEYGRANLQRSPLHGAASTFASFAICGAVPLLPFAIGLPGAFSWSIVATGIVFAAIGALKSRWSLRPAWRLAVETLLIGATAAAVAYLIGVFLKGVV